MNFLEGELLDIGAKALSGMPVLSVLKIQPIRCQCRSPPAR